MIPKMKYTRYNVTFIGLVGYLGWLLPAFSRYNKIEKKMFHTRVTKKVAIVNIVYLTMTRSDSTSTLTSTDDWKYIDGFSKFQHGHS